MIEELQNIFEDYKIDRDTKIEILPMDSINTLSIYLIFKNNNIDITFDKIKEFKTIGDIIDYYESKK